MLRMLFILFCLLSFFDLSAAGSDYTVIPNKATIPRLTSSLAHAQTLKIRLNNGLEAYLFSDPEVDKSSAGLTVIIGSWDEPSQNPGLAHFNEHMLFLGTRKYPKEAEYNRFIAENDGTANAFTAEDATSFMFAIDNKAFPEALDRFASFFKEPLFNPSGVSRELNAINQEYAKNLNSDDFRELFVLKALADPTHPFHRFNMGNLKSLSNVSQDTLKEWYHTHYTSNLMRLAVISPLPLDKLRDLVITAFKDVPNLNRPQSDSTRPLFLKNEQPSFVYIEPVKNVRKVTLIWDLPPKFGHMQDTKPDSIVCYVLGHEGKGSLLAELKREKLAETLSCGSYPLGPSNVLMTLEVGLTDEGLHHLNSVIERCFQAIARFKEKGASQYMFDEVKQLATIRYQYQPREDAFDTIMRYATWLVHEKMETFPQQTQVIERFDPQAVQELLSYMTPQNARYDVMAPESLTGVALDHKEPWMGVPYSIRPIAPELLQSWADAKPIPEIDLPIPNPFIPQHLDLLHFEAKKSDSLLPHPELILDNPKSKIYYAPDTRFLTPNIGWAIQMKTPSIIDGNTSQVVLGELYVKCLKEALDPYIYPAALAGLNCDIDTKENGIAINIDGYSDKASLLLSKILDAMKAEPPSEQTFKVWKAALLRQYQNYGRDNPIQLAHQLMQSILYQRYTTEKEKVTAIKKITYVQFTEFVQKLFSKVYIEGMLYGNMSLAQAKEVGDTLIKAFPGEPYPPAQQYKPEVILLPENKGPFFVEIKVPTQGNIAWLTLEAQPPYSFKQRAALQVLMQDINAPFFEELRTKQQTGYLVYSGAEELERKLFSFFTVQSDTHDGRDLLSRFELFLERYLQEMPHELTEERFNTLKYSLIDSMEKANKNIREMSLTLNLLAFKYDADFTWLDQRVAGLKELTLEECYSFGKVMLGKQNKRRISLILDGQMPDGHVLHYTRMGSIPQIRKLGKYEARKQK
ncbi:MAG: insulinase family protein [Parachlamydia sp.]|nr:insulinase family protein [Parachlamydia sp.]